MSDVAIDYETIDIYLIGNDEEIAEGIKLIDFHFREKIVSFVNKRALSARKDDLFDIYQDVLFSICKLARSRRYDPDAKSLKALIYKIASNKADDWLRKKLALKRNPDTDKEILVNSVAEAIRDSSIYEPWKYAHLNGLRPIILNAIRNLIPRLKTRQRQITEIIKESFPYTLNDDEIKIQLSQKYGEEINKIAIKSARQQVYKKIREALLANVNGDQIDVKY